MNKDEVMHTGWQKAPVKRGRTRSLKHASFRQRQEDWSVGVKPNCACVSSVTSLNQTSGDGCWERIDILNPGGTEY